MDGWMNGWMDGWIDRYNNTVVRSNIDNEVTHCTLLYN